jgi:hypothetical protein
MNTLNANDGAWRWLRPEEYLDDPQVFSKRHGPKYAQVSHAVAMHPRELK